MEHQDLVLLAGFVSKYLVMPRYSLLEWTVYFVHCVTVC